MSVKHNSTQHPWEHPQQNFLSEFLGRAGSGQRIFGPIATPLPMKNSLKEIPVEAQRSAKQHYPEEQVTDSHANFR